MILYGRTGPSNNIDFSTESHSSSTAYPSLLHDLSPGRSSNTKDHHHRSPRGTKQSHQNKILSQILSLDSTIEDSRQTNHRKYKYMKQNTFDSCFYSDSCNLDAGGSPSNISDSTERTIGVEVGSPRNIRERTGVCDRLGSPRIEISERLGDVIGRVDTSPREDGRERMRLSVNEKVMLGNNEGTKNRENIDNQISEDNISSTNSSNSKLNTDCDSDRTRSKSPKGKQSSPCRDSYLPESNYSTIEETIEEDRGQAGKMLKPIGNNTRNVCKDDNTTKPCQTASSNSLSVANKRFNKCKSIDTSIDEIKYDLVGISFVNTAGNSRSNTNISNICTVAPNGTGLSGNKRKFSIGTNGGGTGENHVADLSKPYNLYKCLNQGNRYLKRQYSIDKPNLSNVSAENGAGAAESNKNVVKIQIHRE